MDRNEIMYNMIVDIQQRVRTIELEIANIKQDIKYRAMLVGAVSGFLPPAGVAIYFLLK